MNSLELTVFDVCESGLQGNALKGVRRLICLLLQHMTMLLHKVVSMAQHWSALRDKGSCTKAWQHGLLYHDKMRAMHGK